jgi:hypothetical protein
MDLEKMYDNMPEQLGREACKFHLESSDLEGGVSASQYQKPLTCALGRVTVCKTHFTIY